MVTLSGASNPGFEPQKAFKQPPEKQIHTPSAGSRADGKQKYVLFQGMGCNQTTQKQRKILEAGGVPTKDIIIHEPSFGAKEGECPKTAAGQFRMFKRDLEKYPQAADTHSPFARQEYEKLKKELTQAQVQPEDEITFIGHSAGGQLATTLSGIMHDDPQSPYRNQNKTVVTMGTPFISNHTPESTHLVAVNAKGDRVQNRVPDIYDVLKKVSFGLTGSIVPRPEKVPPNLDGNDTLVEYDTGNHGSYYRDPNRFKEIVQTAAKTGSTPDTSMLSLASAE